MYDITEGKAKRTKQWITVLETTADMGALLTAPEDLDHDDLVEEAVAVLEGSRTPREARDDIEEAELVGGDAVPEAGPGDDEPPTNLELRRDEFSERWRPFKFPWSEIVADLQANYGREGVPILDDAEALAKLTALLDTYNPADEDDRRELWNRLRQPALPSDIGDDDVPF